MHLAYALPLITYKNRWEVRTSVHPLEKRNHQKRNHQKVKTQLQQKRPQKQKKGQTLSIQKRRSKRPHHSTPQNSYNRNSPYKKNQQIKTSQRAETNKKSHLKCRDKKEHAIKRNGRLPTKRSKRNVGKQTNRYTIQNNGN